MTSTSSTMSSLRRHACIEHDARPMSPRSECVTDRVLGFHGVTAGLGLVGREAELAALVRDLPSTSDTSYAGVARIDADRILVTWYSSPLWVRAMLGPTDIWQAQLDLSTL